MENTNDKKNGNANLHSVRIQMVSGITERSKELSKSEMQKSLLEQKTNKKRKRRGNIKRNCVCGKEFNTTQQSIEKGEGKYCSRKCAAKTNGEKLKGTHLSEETKMKIAFANFGKTMDDETKKKISTTLKGIQRGPQTKEHKLKASMSHKNTYKNASNETREKWKMAKTGRKMPEETKQKISKQHLESTKVKRGENHPCWKGGISFEPYCVKWTKELRERIRTFFEYRCIICGKHQSELKKKLHCHHVEYNKKACCDGKPVHFAAMCHSHHIMTNHARERWETMIHRIIDEIYDGKSYYTKEEMKCLQQ